VRLAWIPPPLEIWGERVERERGSIQTHVHTHTHSLTYTYTLTLTHRYTYRTPHTYIHTYVHSRHYTPTYIHIPDHTIALHLRAGADVGMIYDFFICLFFIFIFQTNLATTSFKLHLRASADVGTTALGTLTEHFLRPLTFRMCRRGGGKGWRRRWRRKSQRSPMSVLYIGMFGNGQDCRRRRDWLPATGRPSSPCSPPAPHRKTAAPPFTRRRRVHLH